MSRTLLSLRPSGILKQAGSGSRSQRTTLGQQIVAIVTISGKKTKQNSKTGFDLQTLHLMLQGVDIHVTKKKIHKILFYLVEIMLVPRSKQQQAAQKLIELPE